MPDDHLHLTRNQKERLGLSLADGYRYYGRVSPRKPYRDEDDGEGDSELTMEPHPLLTGPLGAASDLSHIVQDRQDIQALVDERSGDLTQELKKQLEKQLVKGNEKKMQQTFSPSPRPF